MHPLSPSWRMASGFGGSAADPAVVGRTILIDGVPTDVVGVMPATFTFPRPPVDLWLPAQSTRASASFLFSVQGIARLRDDATVATARAEITSLIADLARVAPNQTGIVSTAQPLHEAAVGNIAGALWILLAAVGLVLLVACANIANLFLVRSESRHREVAVRCALGAGTRQLARYFLAESALLGVAGGILASCSPGPVSACWSRSVPSICRASARYVSMRWWSSSPLGSACSPPLPSARSPSCAWHRSPRPCTTAAAVRPRRAVSIARATC